MTKKENIIYRLQQLKLETIGIAETLLKNHEDLELRTLVMIHAASEMGMIIKLIEKENE